MKKEEEQETEGDKIPRKLNQILIERIRKYEIQDTSQLVNGPNDEDTNTSYLGGLINFDGGNNDNLLNNQFDNNVIDTMTENDIYVEPYEYNDYNEFEEEDDEEFEENEEEKGDNPSISIKTSKNTEKIEIKKEEKNEEKNKNAKNMRLVLSENFNDYLDRIQKNYNRYSSNHFGKLILNNKNDINNNKYAIKSIKEKIYTTKVQSLKSQV